MAIFFTIIIIIVIFLISNVLGNSIMTGCYEGLMNQILVTILGLIFVLFTSTLIGGLYIIIYYFLT